MEGFDVKLRRVRDRFKLSQRDVADIMGVTQASVSMYEGRVRGQRINKPKPSLDKILALAKYLNIDPCELIPDDSPVVRLPRRMANQASSTPDHVILPLWRSVSAGWDDEPALSESADCIELPAMLIRRDPSDYVAVQVSGYSLEPRITSGSQVLIRLQPDCPQGVIGLFRADGGPAYLKTPGRAEDGSPALLSISDQFSAIKLTNEWRCHGVAVAVIHPIAVGPNIEYRLGEQIRR